MTHLYTNHQGREITTHSYSSGQDFRTCKRLYALRRIHGWREKDRKAALDFGKCVEAGIQFFYENGRKPGSAVDEFKRAWLKLESVPMHYTAKEGSWRDLYQMGTEMSRLFEALAPTLPIHRPVFQACYRKEVFPGTALAGLEMVGYADIVSRPENGRPAFWDVKTSAMAYELTPELVALDPQLATYAWLSGIEDVGFLAFVKARPNSFDKGDTVTLLADVGNWKAGARGVVFPVPPPEKPKAPRRKKGDPEPEPEPAPVEVSPDLTLLAEDAYARFEEKAREVRGKALEALKREVFAAEGGITVPRADVTKQRLQTLSARITPEAMQECGERIAREIVEIHHAGQTGSFPKEPSVRFPNTKCNWCVMLGHCSNQPHMVEQRLVQIAVPVRERDWLDELEAE